jgi:putative membrane protein
VAAGCDSGGGEGPDPADGHGTSDPAGDGGEKNGTLELAEQRTDWAQERTLLAKQRTFGSWLRSGLSSVAVGFGAAEFLGDLEPQWLVKTASALLVVAGAVIFVIGFFGYRSTFHKLLEEGVQGVAPWIIGGITLAMVLGAGLLLFAVMGE